MEWKRMNQEIQEHFFNDCYARLSDATTRDYRNSLQKFFTFCEKPFDEIKATDIQTWLSSMKEQGLKPTTIRLKLNVVKSFYRYCFLENKLRNNPASMINSPKIVYSLPKYLNKREVTLLQELTKADVRDRALVELLYTTGIRIRELLSIRLGDINWKKRQILIKGRKNNNRVVMLTKECSAFLKAYLKVRTVECEYLFCNKKGETLNPGFVQKQFRSYSKTLGFAVTTNTMRHTFSVYLAERNVPLNLISELLGNVSINSAQIYMRRTENDVLGDVIK